MEREIKNNQGRPDAASKRTRRDDSIKLLRMDIIAPLFRKGYTYRELRDAVMDKLGLNTYSLATVKHDVEALLKEWQEARLVETDELVTLELARIDEIIREAWAAWEKSKIEVKKNKTKAKGVPSVGGDGARRTVSIEQTTEDVITCGDPRYLDVINKALMERRKLLGLYKKEEVKVETDLSFAALLMETGRKKQEHT